MLSTNIYIKFCNFRCRYVYTTDRAARTVRTSSITRRFVFTVLANRIVNIFHGRIKQLATLFHLTGLYQAEMDIEIQQIIGYYVVYVYL